jgi:hypothetical protein
MTLRRALGAPSLSTRRLSYESGPAFAGMSGISMAQAFFAFLAFFALPWPGQLASIGRRGLATIFRSAQW